MIKHNLPYHTQILRQPFIASVGVLAGLILAISEVLLMLCYPHDLRDLYDFCFEGNYFYNSTLPVNFYVTYSRGI